MMRFSRILFLAAAMAALGVTACDDGPVVHKAVETGWSPVALDVPQRKVQCIAIHPDYPRTIYVALFDGLYKTTDAGSSWHSITTGLLSRDIKSVEIVADQPQIVYCGSTGYGLSRSENGGEAWTNMKGEVANTLINHVHLVNQRDKTIWLATATGIFCRSEGAEKWTNTFVNSRLIHTVISLPGNPATLLAGLLYTGFARTTDNGGRWSYVNNGVAGDGGFYDSPVQFGFAGADSSLLYSVTVNGKYYVSADGGESWQAKWESMSWAHGVAMVTHPKLRDRLYLANEKKVYRSRDRGATWSELSLKMPAVTITALQIAAGDPGVIYIGTEDDGLYQYVETQ
jgi:photosystem II stability/assembly factor-like uncharacterized protein